MVSKLYYKNKLVLKLIKPFENKRLFTSLQLIIYTLIDYDCWPKKLIALDAFCQTGLQWTRIFSKEAEYLEMWEINSDAAKYAKKEFPQASVNCGDSIDAILNKKISKQNFNFIIIDTPMPFAYQGKHYEHFVFFESLFNYSDKECVVILNVVKNINTILSKHPHSDDFKNNWIKARQHFYNVTNGETVTPNEMIQAYTQKIQALNFSVKLATYNSRNQHLGIITLVVNKK